MRSSFLRQLLALLLACTLPLVTMPVDASALAPPQQQPTANLNNDQLDSLIAPVALYPDPLLAQILVAATYPLEVIQLQQFLDRNPGLKDQALVDAVEKQDWDPSVQALAPMPDVVKVLSENIEWTSDLGNAFLAQQSDVMSAVQRMRAKAEAKGQLKTTPQQSVEQKVVDNQPVIVIQPANPDVVYVPTYDPVVVYGDPYPYYPYPPMSYPSGWYYGGMALSFGVGMAIGYAWGHNNWGWNCGWGGNNNININNNNNFINHYNNNINNLKAGNRYNGGNNNWQHDGSHRGATPYSNRDVANKYGGSARGDSLANRQQTARQNPSNFGTRGDYSRGQTGQLGQGSQIGQGNRGQVGQGQIGQGGQGGQGSRGQFGQGGQGGAGSMRDVSTGNRGDFGGGNQTFGGNNRSGSRDVSRSGSGSSAFGGASSGMNRSNAGRSQSRGSSSMGRSSGFSGRGAGGGRRR